MLSISGVYLYITYIYNQITCELSYKQIPIAIE